MVAGHFALATAARAKFPEVPLWTLMVCTQLLDIIFIPLYAAGIEKLVTIGGGGYGETLIHADYTHSLAGALIISTAAGLFARKWLSKQGSLVISAVVFSHWILDLIVHRMDMPLLPGNFGYLPLLGFGLWAEPLVSIALETVMILVAIFMYFHFIFTFTQGNAKQQKKGILSAVVLSTVLVLSLITNIIGL
jgi:membrane-bound metal-dependent hydrolase YbcI (DUF457 family)